MKQQLVPKYAHLQYEVLHNLDISINEYFLLDMIYHLSGNGKYWCNKKLDNIAFDMNLSRRGTIYVRDKLISRKLLIKGVGNRLKTSKKVQNVYFLDEADLQKSAKTAKSMQNLHKKSAKTVSKTSVENNSRLTLEYKKAREASVKVRASLPFLKPHNPHI